MSQPLQLSDVQRPFAGMTLLLTGAETDLGRALVATLLGEDWPVARLHLLLGRKRRGPGAKARFRSFCREGALAAPLRERFGPRPDEALEGRVVVHEGVPGRADLGLSVEARAELVARCQVVLIAARSLAPDGDPAIALAREVLHPHAVTRLFPEALVVLASDVTAVSEAAAATASPQAALAEADLPRHFNPEVETVRLVRLLSGSLATRREAAFVRARTLGFPSIRGYAAGIGEARFLAHDGGGRRLVVRTGLLGPAEAGPAVGQPLLASPLDALHAVLSLPLRHLPVGGAGRLYLTPVDRAARLVLLAISQALEGQGRRVMHAMPAAEDDLRVGRAVTLGQLALRRAPADPNPLRGLMRQWRVGVPDAAQAASELEATRRGLGALGAVLGPSGDTAPRGRKARLAREAGGGLGAVLAAGRSWLARTAETLDGELGMASRLVDRWLPERTVDFQPGHLARLLAAGGFEDAPAWARLARPVDWRAWWLTSAMPAALAGAAPFRRRLARREAGPEGAALGPGGPRPFGARSSGAPAGLATPAPSAPAGSTDPRGDAIAPLAELATQVGLTLLARLVRR